MEKKEKEYKILEERLMSNKEIAEQNLILVKIVINGVKKYYHNMLNTN